MYNRYPPETGINWGLAGAIVACVGFWVLAVYGAVQLLT